MSGSPGPAKSFSPMHDEHRAGDGGQPIGVRAWWTGRCRTAARARASLPAWLAYWANSCDRMSVSAPLPDDGVHDAPQAVGVLPEEVRPDAADDDAPEPLGNLAGQFQHRRGAEGEPDGVDLPSLGRASMMRVVMSA